MEPAQELYRFGVALAVGALVGVERQFAGVRDHAQALRERRAGSAAPEAVAPVVVDEPATPNAGRPATTPTHERDEAPRGPAAAPTTPAELDPPSVAGVRTFMLVALAGATAAHLAPSNPWLFPAASLGPGALLVSG